MKVCRFIGLLFLLPLLHISPAFSQLRLPGLLSSNMVLQQNSDVTLWGWAAPSEKIKVTTSWDNKTDSTLSTRDAKWSLTVHTPQAGGPYSITFQGSNTIQLDNIMAGEVWLLSGQSNMEWSALNNNQQAIQEAPQANDPMIRLFHIPKTTAQTPQDDCPATWKVCNPDDMKRFSALGYFFGKKLKEELQVPIGLINASWGGTAAEVWTPEEVINKDMELKLAAQTLGLTPWWPANPGAAYNAMIAPLTPFKLSGTLWYQGESNTGQSKYYTRLFTEMITAWRKNWKQDFPFYFVQIAPFAYGTPNVGPLLREAQSKATFLDRTGMVVISDLVDNVKDIHPQNKKDVADRLFRLAMAEHYGKNVGPYKSPELDHYGIEGNKIRIYFKNAENGLEARNGELTEFLIAGEERKFVKAAARIERNTVLVSSPEIKNPVAVRFGFSNESMPNLFSKDGLPANLFRTDHWED